ncbi:MAG: Hsp20/alpha crystallin family protein [Patescibacteria group bacterium]|nr:Hsp20/alpha crystallin family protein [Patescibacteria group bacterium]
MTKKDHINDIDELEAEISRLQIKAQGKNLKLPTETETYNFLSTNQSQGVEEGELAVDVYQDKNNLIVQSVIGGVKAEDLDIGVENGVLTVRGERKRQDKIKSQDYFYEECYWGKFSRSVMLPQEVKIDKIKANLENGLLTIILPKIDSQKSTQINIVEK